mgnify:CR=1 FL=1
MKALVLKLTEERDTAVKKLAESLVLKVKLLTDTIGAAQGLDQLASQLTGKEPQLVKPSLFKKLMGK